MNTVLVDRIEVKEIRKNKCIGRGKEGSCYFLKQEHQVVKIYHIWDSKRKIYFDQGSDRIAFPNKILLDKETNILVGYTMNYLEGIKFLDGFQDKLSLEELKKSYQELKEIIKNLKDIYMDDNCLENMLYDYNLKRINLIDTSRWYPKENGYIENINEYNWQMITALLRSINWKNFKLNQEKKLYELYLIYDHLENIPNLFLEFLEELENKVSEYKGYKVKKINELKL